MSVVQIWLSWPWSNRGPTISATGYGSGPAWVVDGHEPARADPQDPTARISFATVLAETLALRGWWPVGHTGVPSGR